MTRRHFERFLVLFIPILFHSGAQAQDTTMLMSPYLQAVTTNSIYVLVESSTTDPIMVEYGRTASYGKKARTESCDTTSAFTFVHNIKISGLTANTLYHYRAVHNDAKSNDATFRTAPEPGTSFRFAWMADFRSGVTVHDSIDDLVNAAHPQMSLYGGDLAIDTSYRSLKAQFFRPKELALIATVPFFNTPGNHEKWTRNTRAFTQAPSTPSGTQEYYSFDYGDMHVLVLNNQVPYDGASSQYQFAFRDLSTTSKTWKVVINHNPAYCAGGHGEDSLMKKMSENIFVPNHVDVVFNGHSHFFQHNVVDGIHHMIIGTVGAPLYKLGTAAYVLKSAREYCYGIIDVDRKSFYLTVFNEKGMPLDTLALKR